MTKRKPPKKTLEATAERMAPVLAKVREKIAETQAVVDRGKDAKPSPVPAPTATVTTEGKQPQRRGLDIPGPAPDHKLPSSTDGVLHIHSTPNEDKNGVSARLCLSPVMLNLVTAVSFTGNNPLAKGNGGQERLDIGACADVMIAKVNELAKGGTAQLEQHLLCQIVALESIFNEMARRASLNMGQYIEPMEVYLRLALKAQSQCRSSIETLAEIKNPRPVYLNPRQVNNVAGNQQNNSTEGPQQVNNGSAPEPVRAEENKKPENKLLETG